MLRHLVHQGAGDVPAEAFEVFDELSGRIAGVEMKKCETPMEVLDYSGRENVYILDAALGLERVTLFRSLDDFRKLKSATVHDLDLGTFLQVLSETGELHKEPSYCAVLRSKDGCCALVYSTMGQTLEMDLSKMSGETIHAWWYSPRDGLLYNEKKEQVHGPFAAIEEKRTHTFKPPSTGQHQDWVLVLDDAAADFPAPGRR